MVRPGLINLDFADVRAVMDEMGKAMMGTGEAEGEDRAIQAAEKAIANPLLDEISLRGAKGVLINITGGADLTLFELDEAANRIREEVDPEANIIVGSTMDEGLGGMMRVSVVATGIDAMDVNTEMPVPRRSMSQPLRQQSVEEAAPLAAAVAADPRFQKEEQTQMFEELDVQRAAAEDQAEDIFEEQQADDSDGLPPPAYQPQVAAFEPRQEDSIEAEPEAYVAPRAPAPGTPSPEALARLRAAATKANNEAPQQHAVAATPQQPQQRIQPALGAEKPRFGINSLINRMTGHAEGETQPQRQARQQPPVQQQPAPQPRVSAAPQPQEAQDPSEERIEIPAFLRRQAN
jgi:cell division protein FtsZ